MEKLEHLIQSIQTWPQAIVAAAVILVAGAIIIALLNWTK